MFSRCNMYVLFKEIIIVDNRKYGMRFYKKLFFILFIFIFFSFFFVKTITSASENSSPFDIVYEDNLTYLSMVSPTLETNLSLTDSSLEELKENQDFSMLVYKVKRNDNFSLIARRLRTDISTIYSLNNIEQDGNIIRPGEKFIILKGKKGLLHVVKKGETLDKIAKQYEKFGVSILEIRETNDIRTGETVRPGEKLFIPGASLSARELVERSNPKWVLPIESRSYITSEFSRWRTIWIKGRKYSGPHKGIDLGNRKGTKTKIYASRKGRVTYVGYKNGYGRVVYINHGDGYETRYAHLSKYYVKKGQWVSQGQIIGKMGNTGRSTGPHLHFEVRYRGTAKNPKNYVDKLRRIRKK